MAYHKHNNSSRSARGFPVVNYATDIRGMDGIANVTPLSIPRFKFTYLVEFNINPKALQNSITNFADFMHDGKLYTHLKSIEHPKPVFEIETLRSYNKYIKVPTKVEYEPTSLTFHDDSTSIISSLWLDYINFFQYGGNVGVQAIKSAPRGADPGSIQYQYTNELTSSVAYPEMRSTMDKRPSMGMKIRENDARTFFDSITIYDLGTEPTGVNVYYFHKPFFKSMSYSALDTEDRTGKQEISVAMEYESSYFTTGQNRDQYADIFESHLGYSAPQNTTQKAGIARPDGRNLWKGDNVRPTNPAPTNPAPTNPAPTNPAPVPPKEPPTPMPPPAPTPPKPTAPPAPLPDPYPALSRDDIAAMTVDELDVAIADIADRLDDVNQIREATAQAIDDEGNGGTDEQWKLLDAADILYADMSESYSEMNRALERKITAEVYNNYEVQEAKTLTENESNKVK